MSVTLTLTGRSSELRAVHFPPLDLEGEWCIGLVDFQTYNAIPNIDKRCCKLYLIKSDNSTVEVELPVGSYELDDIARCIEDALPSGIDFELRGNSNTLKSIIKSSVKIDFTKPDNIGPMLGFEPQLYEADKIHESSQPVNILPVSVIRINCN